MCPQGRTRPSGNGDKVGFLNSSPFPQPFLWIYLICDEVILIKVLVSKSFLFPWRIIEQWKQSETRMVEMQAIGHLQGRETSTSCRQMFPYCWPTDHLDGFILLFVPYNPEFLPLFPFLGPIAKNLIFCSKRWNSPRQEMGQRAGGKGGR